MLTFFFQTKLTLLDMYIAHDQEKALLIFQQSW